MPKVSVLVPIYKVEKYIERCVRSLFEQTLDDIEYIFVDDCTPDRSIDILNAIIEEYRPRFANCENADEQRLSRCSSAWDTILHWRIHHPLRQ